MKVVQVVVHRLDVVQNVADSVLVVAGCVVVEQSVADSALVVVQNVADSALRVVLECVCRPLRDTGRGVQLLTYTGGGDGGGDQSWGVPTVIQSLCVQVEDLGVSNWNPMLT